MEGKPVQQFRLIPYEEDYTPQGAMIPTPIHAETRFPRIGIEIDGVGYGVLIDTGAGCTMISPTFFDHLVEQHPDWTQITGALGSANKGIRDVYQHARMLRIPSLKLGAFELEGLCVVSRPIKNNFEQLSARMMTGPAVGALGGNLLKHFCVEMDYAQGVSYLKQQTELDQHDMDMVGLTLYQEEDGNYRIVAVVEQNHPSVLESIHIEDLLLQIDQQDVKNLSLAQVIDALKGEPGQVHVLQLQRGQTRIEVHAPVAHLLSCLKF